MSLKTVLVNPSVVGASTFPSGEFFSCTAPNMGLAYIAAFVEEHGHDVKIIDANALHLTYIQLVEELQRECPDIIGVTATTTTLLDGFDAIRAARAACPNSFTVMGGIHASRFPAETLKDCLDLDCVCIGEGEATFVEIIEALEGGGAGLHKVRGLAYRTSGGIVVTESRPYFDDLDELPLPARHLLPMDKYSSAGHPHRTASIVSSRGCPFGCKFCAAPFIAGKKWRPRSSESLLDEIGSIIGNYDMHTFEFVDDLFTFDKQRVVDLCDGIIERGYEVNWTCSARADTVTPELLRKMAGAGCRIVYYGIESGSQRILDLIGKRETLDQMRDAVRWTHDASMRSWGFFIIGFPDETAEEIESTISFAKELGLDYAEFFICSAFPGSPLYELAMQEGIVNMHSWADISYGNANVENKYLSSQQVEAYMVKAYHDFYTSPQVMKKLQLYGQQAMVEEIVKQTSEEYLLNHV